MLATAPYSDALPFITLPNWVKAAARCGFSVGPVFDELGVPTDLLNVETATIERSLLEAAMERCVALTRQHAPQHHFPFVLGETFDFDYLPDLQSFLNTSPTLREAAQVFAWVRELVNPMLDISLQERGDTARVVLRFAGLDEAIVPRPWFAETTFASVVRFGRLLLGENAPFGSLHFRHSAPPHAAVYEPYFRIPVRFGQPDYALEYPRRVLDRPLPGGIEGLHQQARQRIERRARSMAQRGGLAAAVEQTLVRRPALLGQDIEAVAAELQMHPRTLQRRLRAENEGFGALKARVRYRLARQYLGDPELDIETISERLGFSDRRSFTRAFMRWSGVSPRAYRKSGGRDALPGHATSTSV